MCPSFTQGELLQELHCERASYTLTLLLLHTLFLVTPAALLNPNTRGTSNAHTSLSINASKEWNAAVI